MHAAQMFNQMFVFEEWEFVYPGLFQNCWAMW